MSSFHHLARLLSQASLPCLRTLRLRGWSDATGAEVLSDRAQDGGLLFVNNPLVSSLLGLLKHLGLTELRLENSEKHTDAGARCVFTRSLGGDWECTLLRI